MSPAIVSRFPLVGLALTPQMFFRFEGQAPGLHGPVNRGDGYCKGFPALDLFRQPAFFKPSLKKGL